MSRQHFDAQAGILALTLTEGEPCPVCGSCEHPAPAAMSDCAPTREDVEQAGGLSEQADAAAAEKSRTAGALYGAYEFFSAGNITLHSVLVRELSLDIGAVSDTEKGRGHIEGSEAVKLVAERVEHTERMRLNGHIRPGVE
jgi:exonuclease SbcC